MKAVGVLTAAVLVVAACANLPTTGDGVVELRVTNPDSLVLAQGDTVTLVATALGKDGKEITATIDWSTPDTTISVDQSGLVTAIADSGIGRVQAAIGNLRSNLITFTLKAAPATLK